jgi:hypothetical protein
MLDGEPILQLAKQTYIRRLLRVLASLLFVLSSLCDVVQGVWINNSATPL